MPGLPTRVIRLEDQKQLSFSLKDIACVVDRAGPFGITSTPMLNACLGDTDELHRCHWRDRCLRGDVVKKTRD
jgi:hypothetical protein